MQFSKFSQGLYFWCYKLLGTKLVQTVCGSQNVLNGQRTVRYVVVVFLRLAVAKKPKKVPWPFSMIYNQYWGISLSCCCLSAAASCSFLFSFIYLSSFFLPFLCLHILNAAIVLLLWKLHKINKCHKFHIMRFSHSAIFS